MKPRTLFHPIEVMLIAAVLTSLPGRGQFQMGPIIDPWNSPSESAPPAISPAFPLKLDGVAVLNWALVITNAGSPARLRFSSAAYCTLGVWSSGDSINPRWVWRTNLVTDGNGFGEVFLLQDTNPGTSFLLTATNDASIVGGLPRYTSAAEYAVSSAARPRGGFFSISDTNVYLQDPQLAWRAKRELASYVELKVHYNPASTNWVYEERDWWFRLLDELRSKAIAYAQAVAAMPEPDASEVFRLADSAAWEAYQSNKVTTGITNRNFARFNFLAPATNSAQRAERLHEAIEQIKAAWPLSEAMKEDYEEAMRSLRKASGQNRKQTVSPRDALSMAGRGDPKEQAEALKSIRQEAEQNDHWAQYIVGLSYYHGTGVARDEAEAVKWFRKAAEGGESSAFNQLAWLLATSARPEVRDGSNAVVFAEKAVAATNRKRPNEVDTLAAAYAEAGDFEKAISVEKEAIALAQNEEQKKDCESRLKLYELKTPYRAR